MPKPDINKDFVATALVEAAYYGDAKTCERYGITPRTLRRYRSLWRSGDEELSSFVRRKRKAWDERWAENIPNAIRHGVEFIAAAAEQNKTDANVKRNPMMVSATAEAVKMLADVLFTSQIIDARLASLGTHIPDEKDVDSELKPLVH